MDHQYAQFQNILSVSLSVSFCLHFSVKSFPVFVWAIKSIVNFRRCDHFKNYVPIFIFRNIVARVANKYQYLSARDKYELSLSRIFGRYFCTFFSGKQNVSSISYTKLIRVSFANMSIFPDKNLVVSFTWLLCLTAKYLTEADSWQLNSKIIFVLFEFTASLILASISWNLLFFRFFF